MNIEDIKRRLFCEPDTAEANASALTASPPKTSDTDGAEQIDPSALSPNVRRLIEQRRAMHAAVGYRTGNIGDHARRGDIVKTYATPADVEGGVGAMARQRSAIHIVLDSPVAHPDSPSNGLWYGWIATGLVSCAGPSDLIIGDRTLVPPECSVVHVSCRAGICLDDRRDRIVATVPESHLAAIAALQHELLFDEAESPTETYVGILQRRIVGAAKHHVVTGHALLAAGDPREEVYQLLHRAATELSGIAGQEARRRAAAVQMTAADASTVPEWLTAIGRRLIDEIGALVPRPALHAASDDAEPPRRFPIQGHGYLDVAANASSHRISIASNLIGDLDDWWLVFEDKASGKFVAPPFQVPIQDTVLNAPELLHSTSLTVRLLRLQ